MLKHQHKTLARTLSYIGYHSPGEYGLFWDADGTMPWKEFYWALQEDPGLRFVRAATLTELSLLGIEMPFFLDGNVLRITAGGALPRYPDAAEAPERLYFGVRTKMLVQIQEIGLRPSSRPFLALSATRELALRLAGRREAEPILIEVTARRAADSGLSVLAAGPELYLVQAVPREFLIIPKTREDLAEKLAAKRQKPAPKPVQPTPGSFTVLPRHVQAVAPGGGEAPSKKSGKRDKAGWKRESRKERGKRDIR